MHHFIFKESPFSGNPGTASLRNCTILQLGRWIFAFPLLLSPIACPRGPWFARLRGGEVQLPSPWVWRSLLGNRCRIATLGAGAKCLIPVVLSGHCPAAVSTPQLCLSLSLTGTAVISRNLPFCEHLSSLNQASQCLGN